ncbi:MAG: NAD(P)-binding domain-containing protein [Synergistaceae bacterium]|nr:NAD(P)-binding domain-containing protein [Synergistaceae bacterium]
MKKIHEMKIGMVGFGHLGSSIAEALIKGGFPKSNLMISYRGSRATMDRVSGMKLESSVRDPEYLMKYSDIVILAARPQNIREIAQNHVRKDTLIISFMAALPLSALSSFFDCRISRAMCSGPETISGGRGICVLHHGNDAARELVNLCGMREIEIKSENEIDAFTAGICIPPILMNINVDERERISTLKKMALRWSVYRELSGWIKAELASSASQNDKKSLENVSTKGGVSEAMVSALLEGASFLSSVEKGIERCAELRSELCKNLAVKAA